MRNSVSKQAPGENENETAKAEGKGRPTPRRKDREKENLRPLVPSDRKQARERDRREREKIREGMLAGDPRYLMARDKGPQRAFVRDYVDARTTMAEFLIPVMVVILMVSLVQNAYVIMFSTLALYLYVIIVLVELLILGAQVRKRVDAKFGAEKRERGLGMYAAMRAIQYRRFRSPRPRHPRGEFPH
ncbi:MAG TPA: DUF3043 domain-containing protein [Pseudoclavibacter sp.]|nr:DUF3043 domain-containing protein [Pseudoclavibacter sp.]